MRQTRCLNDVAARDDGNQKGQRRQEPIGHRRAFLKEEQYTGQKKALHSKKTEQDSPKTKIWIGGWQYMGRYAMN